VALADRQDRGDARRGGSRLRPWLRLPGRRGCRM
ncbi:MAG: hypothetical protein AVDCRST_MAG02-909, partial [uncultured Rubrobacteraceae bacterium]